MLVAVLVDAGERAPAAEGLPVRELGDSSAGP